MPVPPNDNPLSEDQKTSVQEPVSPFEPPTSAEGGAEPLPESPTPEMPPSSPPVEPPPAPFPEVEVMPEVPSMVSPQPESTPPSPPAPEPPPTEPPPGKSEILQLEDESRFGSLKKIILPFLVLLLIIGGIIAAIRFGLPRLQKPSEVTLVYWGLWEPDTVMKQVITDWENDHPGIKVNYVRNSKNEYRERLQSALARGEGPDIFRFHNTWIPMLKNELDSVPASVMDASSFEATYYPVARTDLRSGTDYLGIPLEIDTLTLFYNEEVFRAAGKTPPTTWDELRTLASALTVRDEQGEIKTAGAALGLTGNVEHWSDILGLMMLQNGANLAAPTGKLAEDALTYFTLFSRVDRVWNETLPSSMLAFATGKLAMYFGFSWDVFEIKNINPDLEFKVVAAPQLSDTEVNWASYWVEGVSKKSKNQEQAWEFLKYLSSREVMQKLYQAESQTRLFGEPFSRIDMADLIKSDPMAAPFIEQASLAQSWYLASRTFDNGINDRMIKYFEDAVNAVNDGDTSAEALLTASEGVSQLLSQYGLGSYTAR